MDKLLSVVIPVYNVEKYIDRCLKSLLVPKQQLELLDIVIINDGTPDNSAVIAKEYEKKYPGIFHVIDQENRGHGGAWNHGTELAVGKYLFYLDSDDWFDTDQFSQFIDKLKVTDTDLVFINSQTYYAETDSYSKSDIINLTPNQVYDLNTFDWLHTPQIGNATYITHCVYKTKMLKPYLPIFLEKVRYDDIILEGLPIVVAQSFVYYNLRVYNYYKGRAGQSYDPAVRANHYNDVTTVVKSTMEFLQKNTPKENSKRREFGIDLYESFTRYHYFEISREPKAYAKENLPLWDAYIRENHSSVEPDTVMCHYRKLPFEIYWAWFKMYRFYIRSKKWILRHIKK